jgi:hypothetical protein
MSSAGAGIGLAFPLGALVRQRVFRAELASFYADRLPSQIVPLEQQDQRNHDKAQHTDEPRHVDVRQHIGLGDDGVVYAQGSLSRSLRLAETAMKEVRAQAARHVAISRSRD